METKLNEVKADVTQDVAYAAAAVKQAETDAAVAKTWMQQNWHIALGIAVGFLFLGTAIGMKIAHI